MGNQSHLWAVGYDVIARAEQVRDEIVRLGKNCSLTLLDTAVVVRYHDGSFTVDGEPFVAAPDLSGRTFASFLAGLVLGAPPLTGAAVGGLVRSARHVAKEVGIDDDFICQVEKVMKPGSSALFVLDDEGDLAAILEGIRGLGGEVLGTNVDTERAKLIQSTLGDAHTEGSQPRHR
jgi:uncharacterized membrane protein